MFSSSQIAVYRTGSESVATQVINIEENMNIRKQESLFVEFLQYYTDIMFRVLKSHVIPILVTDAHTMENQFNNQLPNFSKKMEELNKTTFENADNIQEIVMFIFMSYNLLEQVIKAYRLKDLKEKVLNTLEILKDFDNVYLGILMKRPEQLSEALNNIRNSKDFEDFETSRTGTLLAFFCLLAYVKEEIDDKQKLTKLFEITDKYSASLEGWVDTIDIMSNPEESKQMQEAEEYYNKRATNE